MGKPICGTVAFSIAKNNPAFTGLSVYRTLSGGRRLAYYVSSGDQGLPWLQAQVWCVVAYRLGSTISYHVLPQWLHLT